MSTRPNSTRSTAPQHAALPAREHEQSGRQGRVDERGWRAPRHIHQTWGAGRGCILPTGARTHARVAHRLSSNAPLGRRAGGCPRAPRPRRSDVARKLPNKFAMAHRVGFDYRDLSSGYSERYRYRLNLEREMAAGQTVLVCFFQAEFIYDSRYSAWSRQHYQLGSELCFQSIGESSLMCGSTKTLSPSRPTRMVSG